MRNGRFTVTVGGADRGWPLARKRLNFHPFCVITNRIVCGVPSAIGGVRTTSKARRIRLFGLNRTRRAELWRLNAAAIRKPGAAGGESRVRRESAERAVPRSLSFRGRVRPALTVLPAREPR